MSGTAPAAADPAARRFKPHLLSLERYRTSTGRDLAEGLCLDRNERAAPFPPAAMKALRARVTSALLNYYPEPAGLYARLSKWYGLPEDRFYVVNGITEGIRVLYETLTRPGDEVVVVDPTYPMYRVYSAVYEVRHRPIGFDGERLRLSDVDAALSDRTAFVCVPNPNLPVESCLDLETLRGLARKCRAHGTFLVVDEAYGFFGAPTALPLLDEFDNVLVMHTGSKAFGLAGVRVGFMISSPRNIAYFSKTRALVESNSLSLTVAEFMLERPKLMRDYVKAVKRGRDALRRELDGLGARWQGGDHTNAMLVTLKDKAAVTDLVAYLRGRKVYVRAAFEPPYDRCIRLTLAPWPQLRRFLAPFKAWLKAHPGALEA